ncbi:hypothetical protein FRC20_002735 [Serendipita sp. 405]|nr:hypothetical protein FRC16_002952 [Serendipita sp. 398]KAG8847576.1 hypothetical protein FRC20_002735 [Serendipita sp. 405]
MRRASSGLSYDECYQAAGNVLDALADIGEDWTCLVGGMAAKLHGVERRVKDLDIAVLHPYKSEEDIQDDLADHYSGRFYLVPSQDPTQTFLKPMYRIPGTTHNIKVDLLLGSDPAVEIPSTFHRNHFVEIDGLPVAPLYYVLYHKLLGWDIRSSDPKRHWKRKQAREKDYPDIIALCQLLYNNRIRPLSKGHMGRLYLCNYQARAEILADYYADEGQARTHLRRIGIYV